MLAYRYGGSQGRQYKLELAEGYVAVRGQL